MNVRIAEKMFWLLLLSALSNGLPRINHRTHEQSKIIFDNSVNVKPTSPNELPLISSSNGHDSLIFPDDRIYFPQRDIAKEERNEYRRFIPLRSRSGFRLFPNFILPSASGPQMPNRPPNMRNRQLSTNSGMSFSDRSRSGSSGDSNEVIKPNENVPLSWWERWLRGEKLFSNISPTANKNETDVQLQDENYSMGMKAIAFQSLFQLPTLRETKLRPCPPNERRNHYGVCTRPFKIFVIEERTEDSKT